MNGTIGEIRGFASNFAPRNWAYCNGQLLAISSNTALFSILGTTYGGDGRTTFALPDLRGRIPVNSGGNSTGPGLSTVRLGARGGSEVTVMTTLHMPSHNHLAQVNASATDGTKRLPTGNILGGDASDSLYANAAADTTLASGSVTLGNTGSTQNIELRNPYLGINMIICMFGVYPSRN